MSDDPKYPILSSSHNAKADIYFLEKYGQLYEEPNDSTLEVFTHRSRFGNVRNMFIKRKIPVQVDNLSYFDILTPYGYGGPVASNVVDLKSLVSEYFEHFSEYCQKNSIVSEFVRFHFFENSNIKDLFQGSVERIGPHIIRDLSLPQYTDMSRSIKAGARKGLESGIEVVIDETGEHLDDFLKIYLSTMDHNDATGFYYFKRDFFERLNTSLIGKFVYIHAFIDGNMIASGLNLYGPEYAYAFLGGTHSEFYHHQPSMLIELKSIEYFKNLGLSYYVLGGGYTNDDGIYRFKRKFARNGVYDYYVGNVIHNDFVYKKLVDSRKTEPGFDPNTKFFPAYRS